MGYSGDDIPVSAPALPKELGEALSSAFPVESDDLPPSIIRLMLQLSRERVVDPGGVIAPPAPRVNATASGIWNKAVGSVIGAFAPRHRR